MDITLFLAQIMGVYFLVAGIGALLNPARMRSAVQEARRSYLLPYFDGAIALIVGLLVVAVHNVWDGGLMKTLVTLVGWLAIAEGLLMLLLPQKTISGMLESLMGAHVGRVMAVVVLLLGLYFVYQGFLV